MDQTDIRKEAIRRVIEKEGPEFLNDPVVQASGIANEVVEDMEATIREELNPRKKKRTKRPATRSLGSRGRR